MKINKRLTASWLSNLSVATLVIGLFQAVAPIPYIGEIPKSIILLVAFAEYLLANALSNKADKEEKK